MPRVQEGEDIPEETKRHHRVPRHASCAAEALRHSFRGRFSERILVLALSVGDSGISAEC